MGTIILLILTSSILSMDEKQFKKNLSTLKVKKFNNFEKNLTQIPQNNGNKSKLQKNKKIPIHTEKNVHKIKFQKNGGISEQKLPPNINPTMIKHYLNNAKKEDAKYQSVIIKQAAKRAVKYVKKG